MSFVARIDAPQRAAVDAEIDFSPAESWTTQDLIMAAQKMRALAEGEEDWNWGYERASEGVILTVKLAGGTTIRSVPLDVPTVVVPADERPHWFGGGP
jgi:hypothetical protein